jgi:hypothetical protein
LIEIRPERCCVHAGDRTDGAINGGPVEQLGSKVLRIDWNNTREVAANGVVILFEARVQLDPTIALLVHSTA